MGPAISSARGRSTRRWRSLRVSVLAESTICILCGHVGSQDVDHLLSRATHPRLAEARSNLAPIHGAAGCPTCGRQCNNEKGTRPLADLVQLNPSRDWFVR